MLSRAEDGKQVINMTTIYQPGVRVRVCPKFFDPFNIEIIDTMESEMYGSDIHQKLDENGKQYSHYIGFLQNPETGEYDKEMIITVPREYVEQHEKGSMICVYGDDCFLKYYFICLDCGTVAIQDDRETIECVKDYGCPSCNKIKKYPFEIITKENHDQTIQKIPDECAIESMRGVEFSARSIMRGAFEKELREA